MEEFHLDYFNLPVRSLPFHRAHSIARTMEEFHLDHFDSHSIATIRIHGED